MKGKREKSTLGEAYGIKMFAKKGGQTENGIQSPGDPSKKRRERTYGDVGACLGEGL